MNISLISSLLFLRLHPLTPAVILNNIFFASSGGIAANRSSLVLSFFTLKSRATSRQRMNFLPSSSTFHPLTHFVVVGAFLPLSHASSNVPNSNVSNFFTM